MTMTSDRKDLTALYRSVTHGKQRAFLVRRPSRFSWGDLNRQCSSVHTISAREYTPLLVPFS